MSQYSPKPFGCFVGKVKMGLNFSTYATNADLKEETVVDTSNLTIRSDLTKLKAEVDKIYVGKLKTVPVDLNRLSNVVNNEVV